MQDEITQVNEDVFDAAWDDDSMGMSIEPEEAADQQQEPETEEQQNEAVDDAAEGTAEKTAEEASETAEHQTEPAPESFTLRYMQEDKQYSRDETITLAQKGLDYDRIRTERDGMRDELPTLKDYEQFLKELAEDSGTTVEALMENIRASRLVERERRAGNVISETAAREQIRRESEARKTASKPADNPEPDTEEPAKGDKKSLDIQAFVKAYPNVGVNDIPQSVWAEVKDGSDLTSAYTRYENKQLRDKIEAMKQNEKNKNRSTGSRKSSGNSQASVYDQAWDAADY